MISWVVNLMLPSGFLWAGFVSGGVLCTWLFVMVGYKKRRNLLKNGMWQLLHQSQLLFLISGEVILLFCNVNSFLF